MSLPVQLGGCCLMICTIFYFYLSWRPTIMSFTLFRPPRRPVVIYAATKFFSADITSERFLSECSSSKEWCSITSNPSSFKRADAVLFHSRNFQKNNYSLEFKQRNPDIPYVLWSLESPTHDRFSQEENFINWTMTYRRDSDVWNPYGRMIAKNGSDNSTTDLEAIWDAKNQSLPVATWVASNCHTANGRTETVRRLENQGLEVDKWGDCGMRPPCVHNKDREDPCNIELLKQYKFYLAFENSNCVDYVTEKFYLTLRLRYSVPVVLQRKTYEDLGIPSSSFIALSDYSSIAAAVKEINRIAEDKEAYLEYHKWRDQYIVTPEQSDEFGFCALCQKLAERSHLSPAERLATRKSYRSTQDWYTSGMCDNSLIFI